MLEAAAQAVEPPDDQDIESSPPRIPHELVQRRPRVLCTADTAVMSVLVRFAREYKTLPRSYSVSPKCCIASMVQSRTVL